MQARSKLLLLLLLTQFGAAALAQDDPLEIPIEEESGLLSGESSGQNGTEPYEEFGKRLRAAQEVTPLKFDAFGDEVSLYNGATTFNNVDISVQAGGRLPVELRRRLEVQDRKRASGDNLFGFSEWDIDVPYITGTFEETAGWKIDNAGDGDDYDRCSSPGKPVTDYVSKFGYVGRIWDGNHLHIPGAGDQELLVDQVDSIPDIGGSPHPWVTKDFYRIGCLATLKNSVTQGEGFVAVSPQGVKYFFDWAIERAAPRIYTYSTAGTQSPHPEYAYRKHVMLLATRVEDRFGQGIDYTYTGDKLTRIEADDGRYIQLTYSTDGARITQAASTVGTWTYSYVQRPPVLDEGGFTIDPGSVDADYYSLSQVTQPDGAKWTYGYTGSLKSIKDYDGPGTLPPQLCQAAKQPNPNHGDFQLTVAAPWGATAAYDFEYWRHYRNYIPLSCPDGNLRHLWPEVYAFFDNFALMTKTISGPGLKPALWTYTYGGPGGTTNYYESPINGPWSASYAAGNYITPNSPTIQFPESKIVAVRGPSGIDAEGDEIPGITTEYTFGVQYSRNEGRLLGTAVKDADGTTRRKTTNTYVSEGDVPSQAFPTNAGATLLEVVKNPMVARIRPTRTVSIWQDDDFDDPEPTFSTHTNTYDAFAAPTSVTRSGVGGDPCTDVTTYAHDTDIWVIGQVATLQHCGVTPLAQETTYDTDTALPTVQKAFGLTTATLAYDENTGELSTVMDGNNHTTTLSDYYLGIPRKVEFATSTPQVPVVETAVVNSKAQITSVTDENGFTTSFGYDTMGRVNLITPPSGDTTAWNATSITFSQVGTAEYGVPAGHWKRVLAKGNYRNVVVYDAMWRPLINAEWDNTSAQVTDDTERFTRTAYDVEGRAIFASYPADTDAATTGMHTEYDALGRVTAVAQDSEQGLLTTLTSYLPVFKTQVVNPRGQTTTTSYRALGEPSTGAPIEIQAPEGVTTTIVRNVLGNPVAVTRGGTWAGAALSATRHYVYDANQRMCRRSEPESGSTVLSYDGAGNVQWSATGQSPWNAAPSDLLLCHDGDVLAASKTTRTYDALNRVLTVDVT